LLIPHAGVELEKPRTELGKVLRRKVLNPGFKLFDFTHRAPRADYCRTILPICAGTIKDKTQNRRRRDQSRLSRAGEFAVDFHDRFGEDRDRAVDLVVAHDQGRQEADDATARADEQQSLFETALDNPVARVGG